MGGANSSQKKIKKLEYIQARTRTLEQECQNTFNPNNYPNLETNSRHEASVLNNIPMYRRYPIDYECGSNSKENNPTEVSKSLDTHNNQACQLLCNDLGNHVGYRDFSNSSDYSISSKIQRSTEDLDQLNYSKDVLVSSLTLKSQPIENQTSILQTNIQMHNTVDSNVNSQTNSVDENIQTAVDKIRGLTHNSWEWDEDEGTSGEGLSPEPLGKSRRELKQRFDSPEKPRDKQTVPNNNREHISVTDDSYYGTSVTKCRYDHSALHHSDYDNGDDNNDIEQFSGVQNSDKKSNHRLSFDVLDILSFPAEWTSCALDTIGFVDVSPESDEGKAILRFFHRTSVSLSFKLRITSVTRIENPFLHSLYMLKKEEMESRNGHVDELYLYHGTKSENVEIICQENLNWRLYTDKHKFGRGVSFSPSALYSSHYSDSSDEKVMFLYKVLVSNAEFGSSDMVIPPIQNGVAFDTSVKEDTSVVVKYSDNEFYPLYKITYTRH